MSVKRTHRIKKLRLRELSFVDEGDNPGAEVLITKRREDRSVDVNVLKRRYVELCEAANELQGLAAGEGSEEGVEKAHRILGGMNMDIEELQEKLDGIETDLATVTKAKDDAETRASKAEDDLAAANAEIEKLRGERDAAIEKAKGGGEDEDEILKSLPAPVRKRLEDAERIAKEAAAEIEKSKDEASLTASIEKVRSLGVKDAEGLGGVLHRIAKGKTTQEDADKVVELLTIAKNVGTKGDQLFEAIGKAKGKDAAASDAEEGQGKLDEAIAAIQKAKPNLTREQAYAEALEANPDLYESINKRHPQAADA